MMTKLFLVITLCMTFGATGVVAADRDSAHGKKALEIYRKVISIPTVAGRGKVPEMVDYLVSELHQAGFTDQDIEILPKGETAALVVRYRGDGSSGKDPILLLAHMDVVEADPKDWQRPPFELTQDETYFYGRGTVDNKLGVTQLISTFIRLKKAGFTPNRDLVIALTGDEETGMTTTRMLAYERADLTRAEFALNTDAGGGELRADGKPVVYLVQVAEKTYATFELTVTNPGGHSSRPRPDNAIYDLAEAIRKVQAVHFPVRYTDMTRDYFRTTGGKLGGELGAAMIRFADHPEDKTATDRLEVESSYVGTTRTTCVPTMLHGGHAENALPQSATVTVNCRIFPGVSVAAVQKTLQDAIANDAVTFKVLDNPTVSPISELRPDVLAALETVVQDRYPGIDIIAFMESGGTDGMHYRAAGIPTVAISSAFMNPDEMFAHGLNERLPIKTFYDGLDHWTDILKALSMSQQ
ncbi:hypothetical protein CRD36_14235 [Paremcibacter congregatus]|uniref:Peptidase M20 dimerisation domain-containing protein n=2 Tax=Paremcibacter congregatus TaxID=2043170 RepID=A0A2G4YRC5_9PROT|nr:hypothetical protein CRD36_14235 [Paremcibacter congregatus]QDE25941.1 M20/M25/M40 family metallo-hydrolase [Paremcibacter congregatus]